MKKTALFGALMLAAGVAQADGQWYMGLGMGQSKVDLGVVEEVADFINDLGSEYATASTDDKGNSWKLFVGYNMNKNFAIEAGYTTFGKYKADAIFDYADDPDTPTEWVYVDAMARAKINAFFVDAVGLLPINQNFTVFGKVGAAHTKTKVNATVEWDIDYDGTVESGIDSISVSKSKLVPKLGLGAEYNFTKNMALRAEYERYFNVGDTNRVGFETDVDVWSLGLKVSF